MLDSMNELARKSNIVHFRPKRKTCTKYRFKYDNHPLSIVDSYKHLGMYMDEHMTFDKCSRILADSAGRALGGVI